MIEIARSYSEKVNLGNYQVADYFCSAKCEVDEKDADQKSQELYEWCRQQVRNGIEEYKRSQEPKEVNQPLKIPTDKPLNFKEVKIDGD